MPADGGVFVGLDQDLAWGPGADALYHLVYLGTNQDAVLNAVDGGSTTVEAALDPGTLQPGTTYFWRVDEVNSAPDYTVFKGNVWGFTVEPISFPGRQARRQIRVPGSRSLQE